MSWSRRQVLTAAGALVGTVAVGALPGTARSRESLASVIAPGTKRISPGARRIALLNLHTDERMEIEYFRDGAYLPEALAAIDKELRDFRSGERHVIDPRLMDYLVDVAHTIGVEPEFSVISGYRSPQTNASLRENSTGVAQHSLHIEGRAIDVRMSGVDCARLAAHAEDLKRGGVGYYRRSDFVHLDTGAFRTWKG